MPKQAGTASLYGSAAVAAPGSTRADAGGPTVQPLQPSAAEVGRRKSSLHQDPSICLTIHLTSTAPLSLATYDRAQIHLQMSVSMPVSSCFAPQAQTQSLAEGLKGAQQALQKVRQGGLSGSLSTGGKPKQARAGVYNPLPDLLRLERGRDTPIGSACDHISVMLRRDSDFGPVAAAFK